MFALAENELCGNILGWVFALFKGSTLQFVNGYSLAQFVRRSRELAFSPLPPLLMMAQEGSRF